MKPLPKRVRRGVNGVWYDSMKHWSAGTGRPVSDAERAKATPGTQAFFKSGRVAANLVKWLDANPPEQGELSALDKERLECERIEKQNRKLDFDHQVKLGQYEKIAVTKAKWATAMEAIMDAIKGLMTREDFNAAIKQIRANIKGLDL